MNSTVAFFSLVIHNEGEIKQTKWIEIYQYYYMYNLQTWPLELPEDNPFFLEI